MTSNDHGEYTGEVVHEIRGVGGDTRVDCGRNETIYGPHPDAIAQMLYCPHCGNEIDDGTHDPAAIPGEVFCPNTSISAYRYCPGCGVEVV